MTTIDVLNAVQLHGFNRLNLETWRNGKLLIGLNDGFCQYYYDQIARQRLSMNYEVGNSDYSTEQVYGHGYSIAEAVADLNRRLILMEIEPYSLDGLSTEHDTHFQYRYHSVWYAQHLCEGEDIEKKRRYVNSFTYPAEYAYGVEHDMRTLFRTQLVEPWEPPTVAEYEVVRTRSMLPAMWVSAEFYPYGSTGFISDEDMAVVHPRSGMNLPKPRSSRKYASYSIKDEFLVVLHRNDLILTYKSLRYPRQKGDDLVVWAYRISEIHEDKAIGKLTDIPVRLLPQELKDEMIMHPVRLTI